MKKKKKKHPGMVYIIPLKKFIPFAEAAESYRCWTERNGALAAYGNMQSKSKSKEVSYIVELLRDFIALHDGTPKPAQDPNEQWEGLVEFLIEEGIDPQKYLGLKFKYGGKKYYGLDIDLIQQAWTLYRKEHPFKVSRLQEEIIQSNGEPEQKGKRDKLFGYAITSVLRWMGTDSWTYEEARTALDNLDIPIADTTIRIQLRAGKDGERGEPANLDSEQTSVLYDALRDDNS